MVRMMKVTGTVFLMVHWLFGVLFKKKNRNISPAGSADLVGRILENEIATFEMLAEARNSSEPYVLLTPVVPLPAQQLSLIHI